MSINIDVQGNTTPLERDVQAAVKRINRSGGVKIRVDEKGVTQPLGNMKRSADEFTKSLEASNARVLAFGASVGIINAVADAFKGLVTSTMKVEKNLTDINVVMGLTNKQLDKFGGGLFKVAKETGAGFDAASEAATEFARQGLSVNETLKRTKDALILTRLTGMKAAESVKSLTAAMNTFKGEISDSTKLVSKFAAVDVKFAVSAEDFAQAIARSGQAARDAGVDLNELIGLVTAAQERTARGGAVIGNSFKTIFTRVQRSSTLNELENIGIAVRDISGNTLPALRILESLAKKYDHLNDAQRAYISQNVAGVFQVNILKAALSDLGKANSVTAQATKIAADATDESSRKNEQLRDTMSALAGETGVAVQQLAKTIGDIALAPGINKILDGIKGLAEGATNLLGNGEDQGNTFAKGVLKGIGNIITGPGLVIIGALFTKLFVNAAKYATSSLGSLLNMNKAAAGRKNIEASLMQVLTQNAALQQEMLRTDISREQKERTILNLIKQQTTEAARLSSITKTMTPTLMRQGVGPDLSYRRRGAYGFIPNYAKDDQEKKMARSAGYTPGHIKTMNIPGAGGMIYNSSETVKNFPGLSQPAIMPPASSKAGENYKKIFADAHGFDPYAAQGYIPNFSLVGALQRFAAGDRKLTGLSQKQGAHGKSLEGALINEWTSSGRSQANLNKGNIDAYIAANASKFDNKTDLASYKAYVQKGARIGKAKEKIKSINSGGSSFVVLTADEKADIPNQHMFANRLGAIGGTKGNELSKINKLPAAYKIATPLYGMSQGEEKSMKAKKSRSIQAELGDYMTDEAINLATDIMGQPIKPINKSHIESSLNQGAIGAAAGGIFESGIASIMDKVESDGLFQNYIARTDTSAIDLPASQQLYDLFGVKNKGQAGAEAKISMSDPNIKSSAKKFLDILGPKNKDAFAYADSNYKESEKFRKMRKPGIAAAGYIPNYDDPLTASIKREKSAGVPVSKIRVGAHNALVNKGNPMGIGVTNTDDEPGGLKDLFGARGFVPNYAFGDTKLGKAMGSATGIQEANEAAEAAAEAYRKTEAELERGKKLKEKLHTKEKLAQKQIDKQKDILSRSIPGSQRYIKATADLARAKTQQKNATLRAEKVEKANTTATQRNTAAKQKLTQAQTTARRREGMNANRGMMGMGAMMAGGMLAGQIQAADPDGTSTARQGIAGAINSASTGAMMGMMFGPLGGAIGGLAGGIYGLVSGISSAKKATKEKEDADKAAAEAARKNAQAFNENSFAQMLGRAAASNTTLAGMGASTGGAASVLGLDGVASEFDAEKAIFENMTVGESMKSLSAVRAGKGNEDFRARIAEQYGFDKDEMAVGEKLKSMAKSGGANAADGFAELKHKYFDNEDLLKKINQAEKASKFRISSSSGGNLEKSSLNSRVTEASVRDYGGRSESFRSKNVRELKQSRSDYNAIVDQLTSGTGGNFTQVAREQQNQIISNLYSADKTEAARVQEMEIQDKKGKARKVQMTGQQIASLQKDGIDSEVAGMFKMDKEGVEAFRTQNVNAIQAQTQLIEKQNEAFIKTLNFQSIEIKIRNDLNQSLQSQAHSARELSTKNKALSAIMGQNLSAAGRAKMETAEERKKISNTRAKTDATAQTDYRSGLFKAISGDTVASTQFRTVFGANQAEDGTISFDKENENLKQLFEGVDAEGAFKKFMDDADKGGVEAALSGIDVDVLKDIVEIEDGILQNNSALKLTLEGLIEKKENSLTLSKQEFDFSNDQLDVMSDIKDSLAEQEDQRKKLSDRLAFDTKQMNMQNASAQKAIELAKLRRQAEEGPGYQTKSTVAANQISDIFSSSNQQTKELRDKEGFAERGFGIEQDKRAGKLSLIDNQLEAASGDAEEEARLGLQKSILEDTMKLKQDERDAESQHNQETIRQIEEMAAKRAEIIRQEQEARGSFSAGMNESLRKMSDESSDFYNNLGQMVPNAFANNLSNAMTNAIKQGGSLKDSLKDAALSFLQTMNQAFAQQFARNATLAMFGDGEKKFRGGLVRRNKGGLVPGMLTNGEYRMNPGAVSKYGVGMMDAVNAGTLPKRNSGGMSGAVGTRISKRGEGMMGSVNPEHFAKRNSGGDSGSGGGMMGSLLGFGLTAGLQSLFKKKEEPEHVVRQKDRFETDGAFKKHNMSAHYMQNNSRAQAYTDELRQQKEEETRKFIEKAEKRAQRGRAITQFVGNLAMAKLGNHLESSGAFAKADIALGQGTEISTADGLKGIMAPGGKIKLSEDMPFGPAGIGKAGDVMDVKKLKKFGYKFGKGNVDRVAGGDHGWWSNATQSVGDFGKKSMGMARKFGYEKKKNSGGSVAGPSGIDRIPTMLSEGEYVIRADAARKIGRPALEQINAGKYNSGGIVASNSSGLDGASPQSGGTNNISITVNVDGSGGQSGEKKDNDSNGDKKDKMDKMSAKIKDQVVTVIKEESRPGGLLDKGGDG